MIWQGKSAAFSAPHQGVEREASGVEGFVARRGYVASDDWVTVEHVENAQQKNSIWNAFSMLVVDQ